MTRARTRWVSPAPRSRRHERDCSLAPRAQAATPDVRRRNRPIRSYTTARPRPPDERRPDHPPATRLPSDASAPSDGEEFSAEEADTTRGDHPDRVRLVCPLENAGFTPKFCYLSIPIRTHIDRRVDGRDGRARRFQFSVDPGATPAPTTRGSGQRTANAIRSVDSSGVNWSAWRAFSSNDPLSRPPRVALPTRREASRREGGAGPGPVEFVEAWVTGTVGGHRAGIPTGRRRPPLRRKLSLRTAGNTGPHTSVSNAFSVSVMNVHITS